MTAQDKRPLSFDLVESLKGKIEHFCADGGLDEQVCSELLQQEFPALKVRVRDATHATRRIPSRATASDDYLASTLRMFITSKNSPAQMIQFRSYFAVKFEKFVHETKGWKCGLAGLGHLCWLRTFVDYHIEPTCLIYPFLVFWSQAKIYEQPSTALSQFRSQQVA